jgi:hypothetical protein
MDNLFPIKIECFSGYIMDEYPKYFYLDNLRFEIKEIQDRWYQGDLNPNFPAADYFKVYTSDEKYYILKHETKNDNWYLLISGESINL